MTKLIKSFLPKKLLPRLLLIFLLPLIFTQCIAVIFFFDRHWEKIVTRFSNIASNQINLIKNEYEKNGINRAREISARLYAGISPITPLKLPPTAFDESVYCFEIYELSC